jgi:hypothetical protein
MSAGGDGTRGDDRGGEGDPRKRRGLEFGDESLGECKSKGGEGWRLGVGDIGDDGRRSLGGVANTGEEDEL